MAIDVDASKYNWYALQAWQLPNEKEILKINVQRKTYFITNFKGEIYAGKSKCPHANGDLTQGHLTKKGEIVCPLHRFTFNLKDGKETSEYGGFCITTYPVKQATDGVFYLGLPKKKSWFGF